MLNKRRLGQENRYWGKYVKRLLGGKQPKQQQQNHQGSSESCDTSVKTKQDKTTNLKNGNKKSWLYATNTASTDVTDLFQDGLDQQRILHKAAPGTVCTAQHAINSRVSISEDDLEGGVDNVRENYSIIIQWSTGCINTGNTFCLKRCNNFHDLLFHTTLPHLKYWQHKGLFVCHFVFVKISLNSEQKSTV